MRKILIALTLVLSSCGANLPTVLNSPPPAPPVNSGSLVSGRASLFDGTFLDLNLNRSEPLVLMFAGEFCAACLREVREYKAAMKDGVAPHGIHFLTLVIGADEKTAKDWKSNHLVPWDVGYQDGDELYKTWCPERRTPCLIVQLPDRGVVLRQAGSADPEELQKLTGSWTN